LTVKAFIAKVVDGEDLTTAEAAQAMERMMGGEATAAQIACFITALRLKGETVDEITGFAQIMREKATLIRVDGEPLIDTCGTGGDHSGTFNISTCTALVAAGAGVKVAKHGNRSVTSSSGSAEVLAALGVNIEADVSTVERCVAEANIGFLFAPKLHAAMKHAIGPRREIGIRTVFNILGPLTNPARAKRQLMGVFDGGLTGALASVLGNLGSVRCMVVHGRDGLDEITTTAETDVAELADGGVRSYTIQPEDFGMERAKPADLTVSGPEESAQVVREVLSGAPGPKADIVLLNSAAAIAVAGMADDIASGLPVAREAIAGGSANAALQKLIELSHA
jgi:anthranilate phosphoribosyltransferase